MRLPNGLPSSLIAWSVIDDLHLILAKFGDFSRVELGVIFF